MIELVSKPKRRTFTSEYKRRIVAEADAAAASAVPGAVAELLEREGITASHLSQWRHGREPRPRPSPPRVPVIDLDSELEALELESERAVVVQAVEQIAPSGAAQMRVALASMGRHMGRLAALAGGVRS